MIDIKRLVVLLGAVLLLVACDGSSKKDDEATNASNGAIFDSLRQTAQEERLDDARVNQLVEYFGFRKTKETDSGTEFVRNSPGEKLELFKRRIEMESITAFFVTVSWLPETSIRVPDAIITSLIPKSESLECGEPDEMCLTFAKKESQDENLNTFTYQYFIIVSLDGTLRRTCISGSYYDRKPEKQPQ